MRNRSNFFLAMKKNIKANSTEQNELARVELEPRNG